MALTVEVIDVYTQGTLADYAGELTRQTSLRITDKLNTPHPGGPGAATVSDIPSASRSPARRPPDTTIGGGLPALHDRRRARARRGHGRPALGDLGRWSSGRGRTSTPTRPRRTLFMKQGIFVPLTGRLRYRRRWRPQDDGAWWRRFAAACSGARTRRPLLERTARSGSPAADASDVNPDGTGTDAGSQATTRRPIPPRRTDGRSSLHGGTRAAGARTATAGDLRHETGSDPVALTDGPSDWPLPGLRTAPRSRFAVSAGRLRRLIGHLRDER